MYKLKRLWILSFTIVSFIILGIAKINESIAENVFALGIYKVYANVIAFFTNLVPFSIIEVVVVIAPFLLIITIVCFIRRIIDQKGRRKYVIYKGVINVLCVVSVIFFISTITMFVNVHRRSVADEFNIEVKESTVTELYEMCVEFANELGTARQNVSENDEGIMKLSGDFDYVTKEVRQSYEKLSVTNQKMWIVKGRPKEIYFSRAMSYTGIVGMYVPFTMETNVVTDNENEYSTPKTMAHELAHLQGYIREDEANYIAYKVCTTSDNWDLKYSGYMLAFLTSANALYNENIDLYREVYATLDKKVYNDIKANSEYWEEIESSELGKRIVAVSDEVNDTYLKVSGQEEGLKTYGMVVDLLLAERRTK